MTQRLYVISDLHLGGDRTYAICSPRGQALLSNFLQSLAEEALAGNNVHLIVNGDSVDFLAEKEFSAFTVDDTAAKAKLASIIKSNESVWNGFARFVKCGGELTLTIGNHDIELAMPGPRSLLIQALGPGKVNLWLNGESLKIGDILIKHGNQYDRWNYVNHQALEKFRQSILSNPDEPASFNPPPGSRLVHEIMNPIKERFSFINLLKPENQAAIPFIGILSPSSLGYIPDFLPLFVDAQAAKIDTAAVAGGVSFPNHHPADQAELEFATEMAYAYQDAQQVGAISDWFTAWKEARDETHRRKQLLRLRRVLDRWLQNQLLTFDTTLESPEYLDPATRAAKEYGFRVILYGHTHLAKRIPIAGTQSVYLNTGTWADLMCVPDSILLPDLEAEGERQLSAFADDLANNRPERWTSRLPTFARIDMQDGRAQETKLLIWKDNGTSEELPSGRLSRLFVKAQSSASTQGRS